MLLVALSVPSIVLATAIVGVRTPDSFIIAADSKARYRGTPGPETVCKIYQTGRLYFAIAGLEHDAQRGFYPKNIIAANCTGSGSFGDIVDRIERAISSALLTELNRLKSEDPESYQFTLKEGGDALSILLAQIQDGAPYVAGRGFQYVQVPTPQISVGRITCPGDCPNGVELFFLGKQVEAKQFVNDHPEGSKPIVLAKKLVEVETQSWPEDVGPPIVVLQVNSNGPVWVANDSGWCPVKP